MIYKKKSRINNILLKKNINNSNVYVINKKNNTKKYIIWLYDSIRKEFRWIKEYIRKIIYDKLKNKIIVPNRFINKYFNNQCVKIKSKYRYIILYIINIINSNNNKNWKVNK
jgi:hypothetical protein